MRIFHILAYAKKSLKDDVILILCMFIAASLYAAVSLNLVALWFPVGMTFLMMAWDVLYCLTKQWLTARHILFLTEKLGSMTEHQLCDAVRSERASIPTLSFKNALEGLVLAEKLVIHEHYASSPTYERSIDDLINSALKK